MKKSIVIAREEFKNGVLALANGSNLPYFVVADILKSIASEAEIKSELQYRSELAAYNKEKENEDLNKENEEEEE